MPCGFRKSEDLPDEGCVETLTLNSTHNRGHIVHKNGKIIPFETMNLFYRDEKEQYLEELRKEINVT